VQIAPTLWETGGDRAKSWIGRAPTAVAAVQYRVGDLDPGTAYDVKRDDAVVGTFTASSGGLISFSDTPTGTTAQTYTVTKSANQPQGGGDGGGGGGALGAGGLLGLLLVAGLRRRRA
jgi:MYXO-CTERM domain-containing protein